MTYLIAALAALGLICVARAAVRAVRRDHAIITAPLTGSEQATPAINCKFCADLTEVGDPRSCTCLVACKATGWCGAIRRVHAAAKEML